MNEDRKKKQIEYLKSLCRGFIKDADLAECDDVVENNGGSLIGWECINHVAAVCRIMQDETMSLEERRRKAYDTFQEQDHSGTTARWEISFLRRFCTDGEVLAKEIEDFKYDSEYKAKRKKEREYRERVREIERAAKEKRKVAVLPIYREETKEWDRDIPIYTTNSPMFLIEYPYRYTRESCLKLTQHIGSVLGLCYGIFNDVPMFSFDTEHTFFMRQHNGMTEDDYKEFRDALHGEPYDGEKAEKILKERTWKHLGKK